MRKLGILVALMAVLLAGIASADITITWINPSSCGVSDTVRTSAQNLTVNWTETNDVNITNITFEYRNTGASSWTMIGNATVDYDVNRTTMATTFSTLGRADDTTIEFRATPHNYSLGTSKVIDTAKTITGCYVDNTKPSCTYGSGLQSSKTYKPTQKWTITGTNASAASIVFGGNIAKTMIESSDTFTFTGTTRDPAESVYTVKVSTTDGVNVTQCSQLTNVKIDHKSDVVEEEIIASEMGKEASGTAGGSNLILIIGLAALAIIVYKRNNP